MRKTRLPAAVLLAAMSVPALGAVPAEPAQATRTHLRGSQCLDPSLASGFVTLDRRQLLVNAGRNRYLIEVSPMCWDIDFANAIGFRGDPVSGRVCGGAMDSILVRGNPPCRIERMQLLSKEQYQQALREREELRRGRRAAREAAKQR